MSERGFYGYDRRSERDSTTKEVSYPSKWERGGVVTRVQVKIESRTAGDGGIEEVFYISSKA